MIQVPRLKHENASKLVFGFRIGAVRGRNFSVLPVQGQCSFRWLKSFSCGKVPVGTQMIIVVKDASSIARCSTSVMRCNFPGSMYAKQMYFMSRLLFGR
jgi:hypothetical protein